MGRKERKEGRTGLMGLRVWSEKGRGGQGDEIEPGRGVREESFLELRVGRSRTTAIIYLVPTMCQALF